MIFPDEKMAIEGNYHKSPHYGILNLIQDEIIKIKNAMPPHFDSIAQFLAISRPIVEVILMNCGDWMDQIEHKGPGKKPFSHASLMLIHILAKMVNVSYRDIERVLNANPNWLKALKLEKAPSHSRLSTFRTNMGHSFFKHFFYSLTSLLNRLGLIKGQGAIVDSAPILASMNFARSNVQPKLNIERVRAFFTSIDVSPAIKALGNKRKRKYNPEAIIRFFMFEKLGGFISTSQALNLVNSQPEIAEILGFQKGIVPVQATFTYFIKKYGSVPELLGPMVDGVTKFFDTCEATPKDSDIDFFFWTS